MPWPVSARVARIAPGVRVDNSTLTGRTSASPWIESRWPLTSALAVRAGGGIYRQEPEFVEVKGLRGSDLDAMRSYHADVAIEGALADAVTWQVSAYNREDRRYAWLPDSEFRVSSDDRLVLPSFTSHYESALDGHSRGVELLLQRRSPNGLSEWIAYNFAATTYNYAPASNADMRTEPELELELEPEPEPGTFAGDYDQRHTLNVYAVYRFSDRTSFSSRFRAGSNFPVLGY